MMSWLQELTIEYKSKEPQGDGGEAPAPVIDWQPSSPNMVMAGGADGLTFRRAKYNGHDVALGQAIESGYHVWTVMAPNSNANNFVGVAAQDCDRSTYPAATNAWAMYLHDAELCSGVATNKAPGQGFTRLDGTRGTLDSLTGAAASTGKGCKNPEWRKQMLKPIPHGTPVDVILDMDARTLSFSVGDADSQLAYTNLPASVHPYLCSGDKEDNSLMVVCNAS